MGFHDSCSWEGAGVSRRMGTGSWAQGDQQQVDILGGLRQGLSLGVWRWDPAASGKSCH